MEKKQLLLITKNNTLKTAFNSNTGFSYELICVKDIHKGYTMALDYLPEVILIDYSSVGRENFKNVQNFKSIYFLSRSHVLLYGNEQQRKEIDSLFKEHMDGFLYDSLPYTEISQKVETLLFKRSCKSDDYWKSSFMGLFNLLEHPVVLLQNEHIIEMNDAFKNYFFITKREKMNISDFLDCPNKNKVIKVLRNFLKSKHTKATTKTSFLLKNAKRREANITFSKLNKTLQGQMVLFINFEEQKTPINLKIGTASKETESYFTTNNPLKAFHFTQREKEIISLLCKGYKTKEISETLCISSKTIEKHRANIIKRTNSDTILESIVYALNHRIITV